MLFGIPVPLIAALLIGFWLGRGSSARIRPLVEERVIATTEQSVMLRDGPWGKVEFIPLSIEVPDEFLSVRLHEALEPQWTFVGYTRERLIGLLSAAPLTREQREELANDKAWQQTAKGILLKPRRELVLSLSPAARSAIYKALAQFPENPEQEQAFTIPINELDQQFRGLAPETTALVKTLLYTNRDFALFADLSTALQKLSSQEEKRRLEKALSRRHTGLMRLYVSPQSDINALAQYWSRAGNSKDVRPLLEALSRRPNGAWMSVVNLLPPWPAARLYSFPYPSASPAEDCHWTSFNFFKDPPDATTHDMAVWRKKLDTEYYPVQSDARYGDLVMLSRASNGSIIHTCVFLADDLVYSKDGAHHTSPWIVTRIPELMSRYSVDLPEGESLRLVYFRNKYY